MGSRVLNRAHSSLRVYAKFRPFVHLPDEGVTVRHRLVDLTTPADKVLATGCAGREGVGSNWCSLATSRLEVTMNARRFLSLLAVGRQSKRLLERTVQGLGDLRDGFIGRRPQMRNSTLLLALSGMIACSGGVDSAEKPPERSTSAQVEARAPATVTAKSTPQIRTDELAAFPPQGPGPRSP